MMTYQLGDLIQGWEDLKPSLLRFKAKPGDRYVFIDNGSMVGRLMSYVRPHTVTPGVHLWQTLPKNPHALFASHHRHFAKLPSSIFLPQTFMEKLLTKLKLAIKSQPSKLLIQKGMENLDGSLTEEGTEVVLERVLMEWYEKNKASLVEELSQIE